MVRSPSLVLDRKVRRPREILLHLLATTTVLVAGCGQEREERDEVPNDEAMQRLEYERKRTGKAITPQQAAEYYVPREIYNYFEGMDAAAALTEADQKKVAYPLLDKNDTNDTDDKDEAVPVHQPLRDPIVERNEIFGRNTWMIWCGGNEAFWDWLANNSLGFTDLLKVVDSRNRSTRFRDGGLIGEPKMTQASAPARTDFGLWLDQPADATTRAWRDAYLESSFAQMAERRHPMQRGLLSKYGEYGAEGQREDEGYGGAGMGAAGIGAAGIGAAGIGGGGYGDEASPKEIPPPHIYGLSSGVVGLRLFPNPSFDKAAQEAWDAKRYYDDQSYYSNPELVRPFRVGMSCAFCHASYHPLAPPRDVSAPEWRNISGNIGAQYLRTRAVFGNLLKPDNFIYHILDSQPPGTIDTSLIASDNINNPNTMNSVFGIPRRVIRSFELPREQQTPASLSQPSLWGNPAAATAAGGTAGAYAKSAPGYPQDDVVPPGLRKIFGDRSLLEQVAESNADPRWVPRVLLDGADSIGAWGALARVYLNIGTFHQQWIRLHEPLLGFKPQGSFRIEDCERHSVYWHATQRRVGPLRDYFLKVTEPMPLLAAEGAGEKANAPDETKLREQASERKLPYSELLAVEKSRRIDKGRLKAGRIAFANNCIVCHSSIQPESFVTDGFWPKQDKHGKDGFDVLTQALGARRQAQVKEWEKSGELWDHDPGQWLRDPDYLAWAETMVDLPQFWNENYLSTDFRIPVNLVRTNSARAMATNAITGDMWADFSSDSYRNLPSIGAIRYFDPYAGEGGQERTFMPSHAVKDGVPKGGGGPGFYRVPTLLSIWTTAPYLHNNSLGKFTNDPSLDGRLAAYDDSIRKLLWPERRLESSSYNGATPERLRADHGLIWRTTAESYLDIPGRHVPYLLAARVNFVAQLKGSPWLAWLKWFGPPWVPSAILMAIAFALLCFSARLLVRYLGYVMLGLAIVLGALLYFTEGKLGNVRVGPIPKGTPVNLLANLNPDADPSDLKKAIATTFQALAEIESKHLEPPQAQRLLRERVAPALIQVSKCPDLVMDGGHYFEWFKTMTDEDKQGLVELLKTF